jgi:hypothetical protein
LKKKIITKKIYIKKRISGFANFFLSPIFYLVETSLAIKSTRYTSSDEFGSNNYGSPEPPIAKSHSLQTLLFLSRYAGLPLKSREENVDPERDPGLSLPSPHLR